MNILSISTNNMESKIFKILLDAKHVLNSPIYPNSTIGMIKRHFTQYLISAEKDHTEYRIYIFLDRNNKLDIQETDKYDDLKIEEVWNLITDGYIWIKKKERIDFQGLAPVNFPAEIRIRQCARGVPYPKAQGFTNIPAWSRGAKPWKSLSPFKIGPVKFIEDGVDKESNKEATIFENFWQGMKVWRNVARQNKSNWVWPAESHVDKIDNPNDNWRRWHDALLSHDKPVRRPNGRAIPLYAWWNGQKLGVVESRKQIYIPYLQELYRKHPTYQRLLDMVKSGTNIIIIEPDGPSAELYPNGMSVTPDLLYKLQDVTRMKDFCVEVGREDCNKPNKYVPYGHGYVIALTLFEDILSR